MATSAQVLLSLALASAIATVSSPSEASPVGEIVALSDDPGRWRRTCAERLGATQVRSSYLDVDDGRARVRITDADFKHTPQPPLFLWMDSAFVAFRGDGKMEIYAGLLARESQLGRHPSLTLRVHHRVFGEAAAAGAFLRELPLSAVFISFEGAGVAVASFSALPLLVPPKVPVAFDCHGALFALVKAGVVGSAQERSGPVLGE